MADQEYIISIPVDVQNKTEPGASEAQRRIDRMTRDVEKFKGEVAGVNGSLGKFGAFVNRTFTGLGRVVHAALSPIRMLGRAIFSLPGMLAGGAGMAGLFALPVQMADQFEQARVGFETMLQKPGDTLAQSQKRADRMMKDIQEFAIRTPFETPDVITQTQRMLAMGWDPKNVLRDMERIGNTAAATGKGALGMERIVLALGQIRMKGKLSAEELNQLTEAGVNAREYIAKGMGVDVPRAMKMAEKGMIDGRKAVDMILVGMKQFDGQMDKTANRTVAGLWSQIKDTFNVTLMLKWGRGLQSGLLTGMDKFNQYLSKNRTTLDRWGNRLEKVGTMISKNLVGGVEEFMRNLDRAFSSDAWQKADTVTKKLAVVWDQVITEPFQKWWNGGGKAQVSGIAESVGVGFGSTLKGFIEAALGVVDGGKNTDPFAEAGATAGRKFFEGFIKAIDPARLAARIAEGVPRAIGNTAVNAATFKMEPQNWVTLALMAILAKKYGPKFFKGGGMKGGVPGEIPGGAIPEAPTVPKVQILDRHGNPIVRQTTEVVATESKGLFKSIGEWPFFKWLKGFKGLKGLSPTEIASQTGKVGTMTKLGSVAKSNWLGLAITGLEVATAEGPRAKIKKAGTGLTGIAGGEIGTVLGAGAGPWGMLAGGAIGYSIFSSLYEKLLDTADEKWGAGRVERDKTKEKAQVKSRVKMEKWFGDQGLIPKNAMTPNQMKEYLKTVVKVDAEQKPNGFRPQKLDVSQKPDKLKVKEPEKILEHTKTEEKGKQDKLVPYQLTPNQMKEYLKPIMGKPDKISSSQPMRIAIPPLETQKKDQFTQNSLPVNNQMTPNQMKEYLKTVLADDPRNQKPDQFLQQKNGIQKDELAKPEKLLPAEVKFTPKWSDVKPNIDFGLGYDLGSGMTKPIPTETGGKGMTSLEIMRFLQGFQNQGLGAQTKWDGGKQTAVTPFKPTVAPNAKTMTLKIDVTDKSSTVIYTKASAAEVKKAIDDQKTQLTNEISNKIAVKLSQILTNRPLIPAPFNK